MAEIYVPGAIDIMGSANQMMQFRNSQQAQQANALQMQYAAEDRARAAQERSAAAGNARAELVRKQQFMDTIKGGYMPAKTAVMGPGTVQGNTPASFDPEKVKNELLRRGDLSGLVTFSNAQEQIAKQQEQEAKVTGQGLTNEGIRATNTGTNFKNTADFIKMTNAQIDAAPDIASLRAIVAATFTPDHPMAKFNELNGLTLEQSMAAIDGLIAQGKTFEQIREQMSQGASKAAENIAARGLVAAQTGSAEATTAQTVAQTAATEEKRTAPVPKEMDAGGEILVYDSNPLSKTHLQILKRVNKTLTPSEAKPAPVTPTNLAKLIAEQAALPEGSADKAKFDAAIAKELAVSDVAQTDLGKAVSERTKLKPGDPLIAQYDAYIAKLIEKGSSSGSSTENERLRAILQKGAEDPNFASTIEYAAAWNASFGEKIVDMPDPNDNSKRIFQRVRVPAPDIYPRPTYKQPNALAPAAGPVAAQPTNALAINAGGYGGGPMPTSQTSTAMQPIRTETGEGMLASVPTVSDAQIKEQARVRGKSDVTQILGTLLKDYNSLEEMKAIPSENRSVAENIPAYLGATALGQEAGKAVGTKAQTLRTNVQSNARFLLTAIKNATGMSAQEMNSIPELQALQEAVTKPTQSIESVRDIIANVDKLYGTGGLKIEAAPKTEAPAKTETAPAGNIERRDEPKIAKLSDIEHTAKVNNLSVEDVKARVRAKGMTIEGE